MQPLTAAPREHLSDRQVSDLIDGNARVEVGFGLDLVGYDMVFREDISDAVSGGEVARNNYATIHGTCRLLLSRDLVWGVDLVRPFMTLSDGDLTGRWNLGVYSLTTPEYLHGETPRTHEVQGYDLLMLLDRLVGADYSVAAGVTYWQALVDTFNAAGLGDFAVLIDGRALEDTLPKERTWPLVSESTDPDQTSNPVTWLRVVNDLLRPINFRSVWVDWDGAYRCQAYADPTDRAIEFRFGSEGSRTILGPGMRMVEDVWRTPNRWIFRQSDRAEGAPPPTEANGGIYVVNNEDEDFLSQAAPPVGRGLVWPAYFDYDAATSAQLVSLGDRRVALDRRVTTKFSPTTGPFPSAWHWDMFHYVDRGIATKVQATSWNLPLDGSDMSWEWEVVQSDGTPADLPWEVEV